MIKLIWAILRWWWRRSRLTQVSTAVAAAVAARLWLPWLTVLFAVTLAVLLFRLVAKTAMASHLPIVGRVVQLRRVARGASLTRSERGRERHPRVRVRRTPAGHRLVVTPVPGTGVEDYQRIQDQLRSAYRSDRVRVSRDGHQRACIDLLRVDLLARPREIAGIADVPTVPDLGRVPVGWTETGLPWLLAVSRGSVIIGGVPDAGKSGTIAALLSALAFRDDLQIIGVDLKGYVEFDAWRPRICASAEDQGQFLDVLLSLELVRSRRMRALRQEGLTSAQRRGFTDAFPLILVVVDEAAEAWNPSGPSPEERQLAGRVASLVSRQIRLGRAAGIFFVLCTQKPTADSIPTVIRDAAVTRVALRVVTDEQARAVLGDTRSELDPDPVMIPHGRPGQAVADTGVGYAYVRSYWVGEQMRREIATKTAHLRRPLESLIPRFEEAPE